MKTAESRFVVSAENRASGTLNKVKADLGGLTNATRSATALMGAFGVSLSVGAMVTFIKRTIDANDELAKMSDRTGFAVETLAGLEHAANLSGTSLQAIEKSLKSLSTQAFDASTGLIESQRNFKALGVSVTDTAGQLKPLETLLLEVADTLAATENVTLRNALANKVLGKAAGELMPLFKDGAAGLRELIKEGQILNPVTGEAARQSELFNDSLERLQKSAVAGFLPGINAVIIRLGDYVNAVALARIEGKGWWESLGTMRLPGRLVSDIERLQQLQTDLRSYEEAPKSAAREAFNAPRIAAMKDEITLLEETIKQRREDLNKYFPPYQPKLTPIGTGAASVKFGESEAQKATKAAQDQLTAYEKQIALSADASELEKITYEITRGRFTLVSEGTQALLQLLASQADAQRAMRESSLSELQALEAEAQAMAGAALPSPDDQRMALWIADNEKAKQIIEATLTPLDRLRKEHEELARVRSFMTDDQFTRAMNAARDRFLAEAEVVKETTEETQSEARDLGLTFTSAFESAVSGGKKLSDVIKGLGRDIAMMMVRKNLTEPFLQWFSGLGGFYPMGGRALDVGNVSAKGNVFGPSGVIPMAKGGLLTGPTLIPMANGDTALGGEDGIEAIMPLKRMRSGRLGVEMSGGGGGGTAVNITQHITVTGGATRADVITAMGIAKEATKREILQSIKRGGAFA